MRISDWSSDVCSSDLDDVRLIGAQPHQCLGRAAERRLVVGEGGAQRSDHLGGESRPKVDHFGNRAAAAVEFDPVGGDSMDPVGVDRSEEHTSELQSLMRISYAVFCLKKKILSSLHNSLYTHYVFYYS